MTHNRDHIVIHSLSQTVSLGDEEVPPKQHKVRIWYVAVALVFIGFIVGLAAG